MVFSKMAPPCSLKYLWISCCLVWMTMSGPTSGRSFVERDLVERLLTNYDPDSRPVRHGNNTVTVRFLIQLQQIVDLDEKNQILMTQMLVRLDWKDAKLIWDPRLYDGLDQVVLPATSIWLPDIYVYNNAAGGDRGFLHVNQSRAIVSNRGHVLWTVPATVKSSCSVDALYFPFDQQFCNLKFASWTYDHSQLDLVTEGEGISTNNFMENSELALVMAKVAPRMKNTTYSQLQFSQIILYIHIQRKALFYTYTVIAPSILLCIFTVFSFWLPSDNAEKIEVGLTVFLFLYFLQLMIAENTPESNSTPLIGTFLTMVMTLNSVSLIMATLVMHVKKRGESIHCPNVPRWLWLVAVHFLGRITLSPYSKKIESCFVAYDENDDSNSLSGVEDLINDNRDDFGMIRASIKSQERTAQWPFNDKFMDDSDADEDALFSKADLQRLTKVRMYQWLYVAQVMDKFLFEIYFVGTTTACFIVLIYVPQSYKSNFMD